MLFRSKSAMVTPERALPGHGKYGFTIPVAHYVNGHSIQPPFPDGLQIAIFGLGCFWGAEEIFWKTPGVWATAVGYAGGFSPYPSYEEVCSGRTGHAEVAVVVFDPDQVGFTTLVARFFELHDPTQGMRQGHDSGSQYRSAIYYTSDEQRVVAEHAVEAFGAVLAERKYGAITTEVAPLGTFYYAEPYHQQYLAKNPHGYRCHSTTGLTFPLAALGAGPSTPIVQP